MSRETLAVEVRTNALQSRCEIGSPVSFVATFVSSSSRTPWPHHARGGIVPFQSEVDYADIEIRSDSFPRSFASASLEMQKPNPRPTPRVGSSMSPVLPVHSTDCRPTIMPHPYALSIALFSCLEVRFNSISTRIGLPMNDPLAGCHDLVEDSKIVAPKVKTFPKPTLNNCAIPQPITL